MQNSGSLGWISDSDSDPKLIPIKLNTDNYCQQSGIRLPKGSSFFSGQATKRGGGGKGLASKTISKNVATKLEGGGAASL